MGAALGGGERGGGWHTGEATRGELRQNTNKHASIAKAFEAISLRIHPTDSC